MTERRKPPAAGKGRPKGALNKSTVEVRDFARRIIEDPNYQRNLQSRVERGKAPHMETLLFAYAYGKPKESVEHTGALRIMWETS